MKNKLIQRIPLILLLLNVWPIGAFAQQGTSLEEPVARLERRVKQLEVLVKRLTPESPKPNEGVDPVESNRDAIIIDLNNLAMRAYSYRTKLMAISGGQGSYVGFVVPEIMKKNVNASYKITTVKPNSITFTATSARGYGTVIATVDADAHIIDWRYTGKFAEK